MSGERHALNERLLAFTQLFADPLPATGQGALSGHSFAVKDLLDVGGYTTTAGSIIRADAPPAAADAVVVARLRAAGAHLVGTTNMDEFAYGFVTENAHYGTTRNPHDAGRIAGGSSGGSATAVAAHMVDFALGSDTNGSIRIPASLCGIFGLRPTHGLVSEDGCFPFVEQLDVVGPFARTPELLRRMHAAMIGQDIALASLGNVRVGVLSGWFSDGADADALAGVQAMANALGRPEDVALPLAGAARSAAFLITAAEGGQRHLAALKTRAMDFDPATRDRLLAGALLPPDAVTDAQKLAAQFVVSFADTLDQYDLLLAPSTPCVAPKIGEPTIIVNGKPVNARANLGLYAQPLSLTGAPVLSVPLRRPGHLPLGVQVIAAKGREDLLFSAAEHLVAAGIAGCDTPALRMEKAPC